MPSQYVCSKKGNSFYTQVTNSIFGFETSSIKLCITIHKISNYLVVGGINNVISFDHY